MNLTKATELALQTDYAVEAVGQEINTADAGAFFLEGFLYAQNQAQQIAIQNNQIAV